MAENFYGIFIFLYCIFKQKIVLKKNKWMILYNF